MTLGRPKIENRQHLDFNKYHAAIASRGIHTRKRLAELMCDVSGEEINPGTVKVWEQYGWPPERYMLLLRTLGISSKKARHELFSKKK